MWSYAGELTVQIERYRSADWHGDEHDDGGLWLRHVSYTGTASKGQVELLRAGPGRWAEAWARVYGEGMVSHTLHATSSAQCKTVVSP